MDLYCQSKHQQEYVHSQHQYLEAMQLQLAQEQWKAEALASEVSGALPAPRADSGPVAQILNFGGSRKIIIPRPADA